MTARGSPRRAALLQDDASARASEKLVRVPMELVHRTCRVLEVLSEAPHELGVSALSERVDLPISSTHRLLSALIDCGFVRQNTETRRYRLGPGALRIRDAYLVQAGVCEQVLPALRGLASQLCETVFLTVLDNGEAICARIVASQRQLNFFMRPGQAMPLHCTASAKAILAFQPTSEVVRLLSQHPLTVFTSRTPRDVATVLAQLDEIRASGYAISVSELDEGVTAVAAPVRAADGRVTASITVLAPSERLEGERRDAAIARLLACASQASQVLGSAEQQGDESGPVFDSPLLEVAHDLIQS